MNDPDGLSYSPARANQARGLGDSCPLFTHNNFSRYYKIMIDFEQKNIIIHNTNPKNFFEYEYLCSYEFEECFIGVSIRSPMTERLGTYGKKFDGNTIVFKKLGSPPCEYIFIGDTISMFTTDYPIVKYISTIGNNDVPYAYAIDTEENYYLLHKNVMMGNPEKKEFIDPYQLYYSRMNLCKIKYDGITNFLINDKNFTLDGDITQDIPYYYERIKKCHKEDYPYDYEIISNDKNITLESVTVPTSTPDAKIEIIQNGERRILSEESYIEIVNKFAKEHKYKKIIMTEIHNNEKSFIATI
jgi:hypothetical protein